MFALVLLVFVLLCGRHSHMCPRFYVCDAINAHVASPRHDTSGQVEPRPPVIRDRRAGRYGGRHAAGRLPRGHA